MNYSGVGAHHQNLSERQIQTIFNWSRALLLHFVLHWPQQAKENLWPFAVDHAIFIWNNLPSKDIKLCPLEILSNTLFPNHHHLQRTHVFGCPVYVLDPRIQDNQKIPKWSMRSRRGIYLGISKEHSSDRVRTQVEQNGIFFLPRKLHDASFIFIFFIRSRINTV